MTTIANSAVAKLSVAFVTLAMAFTLVAPAQAQSVDDMSLEDLIAMVNTLQSQLSGGDDMMVSTSSVCPYNWTRSLNMGDTGSDVMMLQKFLNSMPETMVAASGAGSAGMETEYYGPATGAAVANFQMKYRSEILSPLGLVNPTTFFGNSTRAQANDLCMVAPTMPDMDDEDMDDEDMDDEDMDDDDSDNGPLRGDEAEVDTFELDDAEDDDIEEGQENEPVAEIELEFEDGDVSLERFDIEFALASGQSVADNDPWDVFETISLWVDGEMIAEENADDEDDWLSDDMTMRFSGLDFVVREDDNIVIVVAVTTQDGLDLENDDTADWEVNLDTDALRVEDATGDIVRFSRTDGTAAVTFTIEEEGGEDEIFVRTSSSDPDSTTIELEDDENSDWVTIFAFDLDTEDSVNDIEMNEIRIDISSTEDGSAATTTDLLVDDAQLLVDGEVYDDVTITSNGNVFTFDTDDDDWMIEAGDRVTVEFQVEFEALASNLEGATVEATVDSANIDAEGADDLIGAQLSGSATGEQHTLRTEGAILALVSTDEDLKENNDATAADDEGVFTIKFDVTAFESDIFVNKTAASGTTMGTAGANFLVEDANGVQVLAGTSSASLTSTADTEGTRFQVDEGETETFTLTVEYDPVAEGFFQLQLYSINFNIANANPNTQQRALDESDYETDSLSI